MGRDFYSVLGVPRNASEEDIKKAYRRQALLFHPDKNKSPGAEEQFKRITEAYSVLTEPDKRRIFDAYGEEGLKNECGGFGFGAFTDPVNIFRDVFGDDADLQFSDFMDGGFHSNFSRLFSTTHNTSTFGGFKHFGDDGFDFPCPDPFEKQTLQDPPIETNIQVTLEELATGCTKRLKLNRQVLSSSGQASQEEKILTIEVKPGWKAGTKVTFERHGDQKPGVIPADIIFVIGDKPHQYFRRDAENNLLYTAKVNLRDVLCGCVLQIPTINGRVLAVQLNEVIQPGTQKRVPNEGLPLPKYPGKRGDMIVTFDVEIPTNLTMEQRQHIAGCF